MTDCRRFCFFLRWALVPILLAGLTACAWIREDHPQKPLIKPEKIHLADEIHLAGEGWPAAQWWTRYGDPQLTALIERALEDSPTMRVARARIEQARARVELANAGERPTVALLAGASRQWVRTNGNVGPISIGTPIPGLAGAGSTHSGTLAGAGLLGSYSLDFRGLESSVLAAAIGAENAQLAETAATQLGLSTTIAETYFNMQAAMQKVALLEKIRDILAYSVAGMEARKQRGLLTAADVSQAKIQLIETRQSLSGAQAQVTVQRAVLRALVGAGADNFPGIEPVALPRAQPRLPKTLSYSLLSHRPDLVAMRWSVQASLDQVQAARAAFYPSFDIKAFLGFTHIDLGDVLNVNTRQFSLIPGLTLPIFAGGRLNANLHQSRASSNALIEQYNQAVLNAVRDVAIAATKMQALQKQMQLEKNKREQIRQSVDKADANMERGLASRMAARQAKIPLLKEKIQLLDTKSQSLAADISLIKALGGGYALPQDKLPPAAQSTASSSRLADSNDQG